MPEGYSGPFGIKVFVGQGAGRRLLVLPPVKEVSLFGDDSVERSAMAANDAYALAQTPPAITGTGWNLTFPEWQIVVPQNGGWNLVTAALIECGANTVAGTWSRPP